MIGNSRLHWAKFTGENLLETWDSPYWDWAKIQGLNLPVTLASVVPEQTEVWQQYSHLQMLTLNQIPLKSLYPTLGIDRALAVLGAGEQLGWPILLIDAGTALTLTGADERQTLMGGAILPGLKLQFATLNQQTAALPPVIVPDDLPQRWANETTTAIQSGILYTILAGVRDFITAWLEQFPDSQIALTGGDAEILKKCFGQYAPGIAANMHLTPAAIFWGMGRLTDR